MLIPSAVSITNQSEWRVRLRGKKNQATASRSSCSSISLSTQPAHSETLPPSPLDSEERARPHPLSPRLVRRPSSPPSLLLLRNLSLNSAHPQDEQLLAPEAPRRAYRHGHGLDGCASLSPPLLRPVHSFLPSYRHRHDQQHYRHDHEHRLHDLVRSPLPCIMPRTAADPPFPASDTALELPTSGSRAGPLLPYVLHFLAAWDDLRSAAGLEYSPVFLLRVFDPSADPISPLFSQVGATFGACLGLFFLALLSRFLAATKACLEKAWFLTLRNEKLTTLTPSTASLVTNNGSPSLAKTGADVNVAAVPATLVQRRRGGNGPSSPHNPEFRVSHDVPRAILFGLQNFVQYMLMLAVMSFNGFFCASCASLLPLHRCTDFSLLLPFLSCSSTLLMASFPLPLSSSVLLLPALLPSTPPLLTVLAILLGLIAGELAFGRYIAAFGGGGGH